MLAILSFFTFLLVPFSTAVSNQGPDNQKPDQRQGVSQKAIALNTTQKRYILENPVIKVAATKDWPPFEFKENGRYQGLHADILRLAAKKTGLEIKPVFDKWANLVSMLKNGDLDLCPGLNATDERKKIPCLYHAGQ